MNQKNKDRAKQIFEKSNFDTLYMNKKGNFFSSKNLALNSVKDTKEEKDRKIEKVSRADVLKSTKPAAKDKLIVTAADESKICFVDLTEGDTPKVGDKAKIGNKNAEGTIKMTPQISYKFDKGVLSEIIENKA